ncbi:transcriptional regulator, TetR family [Aquipluma nitroreducens]|uniref:Transcriptional regulator, TetR family n=1 Tax=Aquipluma nitroreducens TaxID=2010828 RepID=A0A5K7S9J0_9BACT|nr:TetR/AcrR family transcriptional regulator [Aquipluma nitroreducens]BBE18232.1 transcriptional regulator, TetR family [Aquipluma nitroreducens]
MSVTREKILELAEELILNKGYNGFSYQDISTVMGIKNAAVHYYFPSKDNLGVSILKTNVQRFEEMVENMQNRNFDEWQQLESFMKIYLKSNRENKICLIGSLGTDINTLSDPMRVELQKMVDRIILWLESILQSGREKGLFQFNIPPRDQALSILSSLVAGLQLARILSKSDFKNIHQSIWESITPPGNEDKSKEHGA